MNVNKQVISIAIKMIITGIITIFLGYILNLQFYTTAAAVGILSIQATRKDFISIAVKRYISGFLSLVISAVLFRLMGLNLYTFALFLLILISLSWLFKASEGIVLSVVLVTHFLIAGQVTKDLFLEEVLLLTISIGIAFLVNMFYPSSGKRTMISNLEKVDKIVKDYLLSIIDLLAHNSPKMNEKLVEKNKLKNFTVNKDYGEELKKIIKETEMIDKDLIIQNDHSYLTYLYMREIQIKILNDISKNISKIEISHSNTVMIIDHLTEISENISFNNQAVYLYNDHLKLKNYFMQSDLPKTRLEFEARAILFQILLDIERFLTIKIDFHLNHPHFNEKEF